MTSTQYLRAFTRYWWVIALCAVLGIVLPLGADLASPREYSSSTSILITGTPSSQPSSVDAYQVTLLALQRMTTYSDLARSQTLSTKILAAQSAGDLTPAELAARTTTTVRDNSTVMKISIEDPSAARAQQLAAKAGPAMVALIRGLEKQQAQGVVMLDATVVVPASVATPSGSDIWRNPFLGGLLGLLVGLALAVTVSRVERRVRDDDEAAEVVGAPLMGRVPLSRRTTEGGGYAAAVREVRTGIFFLRETPDECVSVAFTGPRAVDGLADVVDGVADALAETGSRVHVVRLEGEHADPLQAHGLATLLEDARDDYDYVLVSAPATSEGTDAEAVAALCSSTVVVVEVGTRRSALNDSLRHLRRVGARVRGVVLLG